MDEPKLLGMFQDGKRSWSLWLRGNRWVVTDRAGKLVDEFEPPFPAPQALARRYGSGCRWVPLRGR